MLRARISWPSTLTVALTAPYAFRSAPVSAIYSEEDLHADQLHMTVLNAERF
jgi:hypothetical protein